MPKIMEDRPYQTAAISRVTKRLKKGERVVLVAPTGSGKTYMGARIAMATKGRVVWVAHRRELLHQAARQFRELGCDVGVLSGEDNENPTARVLVATPAKAAAHVGGAKLLVIDEAHRATSRSYAALYADDAVQVVGLTATPWRLDRKGLGRIFTAIELAASVSTLIAGGYLARPAVYGISKERAAELVRGITVSGDFAQGELAQRMMKADVVGDVVSERERLGGERTTVVFAVDRAHARCLTRRFRAAGRTAEWVDAQLAAKTRERILSRFRDGDVQIVVNVDVLSEGFDLARIKCVSIARPTRSLSRYLQHVGRALRPFESVVPIVIDHVGNAWRHGLPDTDYEWSLEDRPADGVQGVQGDLGGGRVLRCPACGAHATTNAALCLECGADLKHARELYEDAAARLVELRADRTCAGCGKTMTYGFTRSDRAGKRLRFCKKECRGTSTERVCAHCGKKFKRSAILRGEYCTLECSSKGKRKTRTCCVCGGTYHHKDCTHKTRLRHCSVECAARSKEKPVRHCDHCGAICKRHTMKYCAPACAYASRRVVTPQSICACGCGESFTPKRRSDGSKTVYAKHACYARALTKHGRYAKKPT